MNYFDQIFFEKYLREGEELLFVCHKHIVLVIDTIILLLVFGLALPTFFYYNDSFSLTSLVPFQYFELYAVGLYCYIMYRVFDWYNDVWLITDQGIVDIDWDVFARSVEYIEYQDIKWAEIHTSSFFDSFLKKGDITVYSHGEDSDFILEGANNPYEVVSYINEITEEMHHHDEDEEKEPFEVLLHTLTEMVKEHLEWGSSHKKKHHGSGHSGDADEWEDEEEIEKVLGKKGTIDLR